MDQAAQQWITVVTPAKPRWKQLQLERSLPKNEHMRSMREASARTHRLNTEVKKGTLLRFLTSPSIDFDGSNASLAKALQLSVRTVIRLLKGLEADGRVKVSRAVMRTAEGFCTKREIQILGRGY